VLKFVVEDVNLENKKELDVLVKDQLEPLNEEVEELLLDQLE
jgi:hypothetical protein